jgi:3-methyladenine DNA glycosylase AlkC
MSQAARPAAVRRPWPKWLVFTLWGVLGLLAATLLVFMATLWFGGVHGTEFSPQTFERRSYSFYELPLIRKQVTAIRHDDLTGVAETFLTSKNYVATPPAGAPQDWHIIVGSQGTKMFHKGDASILMQYLDSKDSADYHRWVKWSEDHPKLAKVLWPAVQRLAQDDLYIFIPDLFLLAKQADDPVKLQAALNKLIAAKLLFLADRLQDRHEHAEAIKLLDEAIQLDPANQELTKARETSRTAVKAAHADKGVEAEKGAKPASAQ